MSTVGAVAIAFVAGCLVWNYFGDKIKVWLHLKEKQVGADIKSKL